MIEENENQVSAEELGAAITGENPPATPPADPKPQPEKSLRDELVANLKDVQGRPRDEHGRFARNEQPAAQQQKADPAQPPKPEAPAQPVQPAQPAPQQAPTSWSTEAKAEFGKLPKSVQDAISKRETEVHRGFTALDEDRNLGKQMKDVISPYLPIIQAEGGTPVAAVRDLLNSAYVLRQGSQEQKIALVKQLCNRYSIPFDGVTAPSPNPQGSPAPQQQPGITREEVEQIAVSTAQHARLQSMVEAFRADPANKHFEQVKGHMAALLQAGMAASLKDAYEQACRAHPDVSSSLAAEKLRAEEEQRQAALRQKATAARHAGGSVNGGPGASTPPAKVSQPDRSLRDELMHNLAQVTQQRI